MSGGAGGAAWVGAEGGGEVVGGRFRVVGRLGDDAASALYRAETLVERRPVALRVLRAELPATRVTAILEAVAALRRGSWEHQESIVAVVRGRDEVAIASAWLEGESLAEVMTAVGPLGWELTRELAWTIGSAVAELWAAGIVFGGLAPRRGFLAREYGGVHVRLVGVGVGDNAIDDPEWAAPAQRPGGAIDARADVFALAAIVYAMACGAPPRADEGVIAPPRALRPGCVTPAVEAVILRGLAAEPARRFPGVAAMLAALAVAESSPG